MIKVVTHYATDDPECISDYVDVEVFIHDKLAFSAGDYYHEKGCYLVQGFLEGYKYTMDIMELELEEIDVADREI